jgi:stress response protein SCP2
MGGLSIETVVVLGELYRRGAEWKVRSISQGYAALDGLLRDYGLGVSRA